MKPFNKTTIIFCSVLLGLAALAGCEDERFYTLTDDAPDIETSSDSTSTSEVETIDGLEDVYTFGETDYSSSWWSDGSFSKYYQIPDGGTWQAQFTLNIDPDETIYYENFALVVTNDEDRDASAYSEYGAIRFDATSDTATYNSQWGYLYFQYTTATLLFTPDDDEGVTNLSSLGGTVTVTVDRSDPDAFTIEMTNGTQTKTYAQPYALGNLNTDSSNDTIRCFIAVEGSYIDFALTTIEPIGGLTSANDKDPVSMVLNNVPEIVELGDSLESAMADVTATVTFDEGVTKTVTADELTFSAIPDMTTAGEKTLVAVYNKTYNGEYCETPVMASATFTVEETIVALEITTTPSAATYYYYTTEATESMSDRSLVFDPTGLEVTAIYSSGSSGTISNSRLTFSTIPAEVGTHDVTVSYDDVSATLSGIVTVVESFATQVHNTVGQVGESDFSSSWWTVFSDDFTVNVGETAYIKFTNYSDCVNSYDNYVVILRNTAYTEYAVVRADNYGWGDGYEDNDNLVHAWSDGTTTYTTNGNTDATWLAAMAEADVTVYVTNCNNGTADVQAVITGKDGVTYTQYYLGIDTVDPDDLTFALTLEECYLVFE